MKRREFIKISCLSLPALSGCGFLRIDPMHVLLRSEVIETPEKEAEILSRAKLEYTEDGRIRVLHLQGTPYEIGYQHGRLLREEVNKNIGYLYDQALSKFHFEELFAECFERMRPFIHQDYIDEMHGLAHGAKMPLHVIHHIHALPEIGEWGGKKAIVQTVKKMMKGELGTSCSNLCANRTATKNGKMYTVRILDWGLHRISRLHEYPLITVCKPNNGIPYSNIGWVGFIGAVSGMNAKGITLGEMGYGDPPGETLRGRPMCFLLRDILSQASNLRDVKKILKDSLGTCSYAFLMSDGKTGESELYVKDRERFIAFPPGKDVVDKKAKFPAIKDIVYGGHYADKMTQTLTDNKGNIDPELLMKEIIPTIVMKSNFQNVIYDPSSLAFWVSNAKSKDEAAAGQPYTFFDLKKALL